MTRADSNLPDDDPQDAESLTNADKLRVTVEIAIAALILAVIYYLFAPEEKIELTPPLQESQSDSVKLDQKETTTAKEITPSNPPSFPEKRESETKPVDTTVSEGESARELIKRLRTGELNFDSQHILEQAAHHQNDGRLTDAYLLLFYAAREGDAEAAFSLASMHDPNHFTAGNPLLDKPDAFQAHKWYSAAQVKGMAKATERLKQLRKSAEEQAKRGDSAAMRLLLNWQ
jgi:TPR repeat protein